MTIIQHPSGGPKQIALNENRVTNIYQHYLQYTTDTEPGSSGSPVFNDDWEVVGLHHAGGDLRINDKGYKRFINQAILIKNLVWSKVDIWRQDSFAFWCLPLFPR